MSRMKDDEVALLELVQSGMDAVQAGQQLEMQDHRVDYLLRKWARLQTARPSNVAGDGRSVGSIRADKIVEQWQENKRLQRREYNG